MPDQPICIEVPQVLDFCFQVETADICLPIAAFTPACTCNNSAVQCSIPSATCLPVGQVASATPGFFDVTFAVSFSLAVTLVSPTGGVLCSTIVNSTPFTKTVVLCAPDGATVVCEVASATCGPCICIDDVVCCSISLCLVIKSIFTVVLAVVGTVLTPTLCVTPGPFPPICPPLPPTICVNCPTPVNGSSRV